MATGISDILQRLRGKVDVLTERYQAVKTQRDGYLAECEDLKVQIADLKGRLQKAETEIEYLRISHKIAPTEEDARMSREAIAGIIKKIDKCIVQLRKD